MSIKVSFQDKYEGNAPLVVGVLDADKLSSTASLLDQKSNQLLTKSLTHSGFTKDKEDVLVVNSLHALPHTHVVLLNISSENHQSDVSWEKLGSKLYGSLAKLKQPKVVIDLSDIGISADITEKIARIAAGLQLRSWSFNKYKTVTQKKEPLVEAVFVTPDVNKTAANFQLLEAINEGVFLTRTVVTEPPNVLNPASMSQLASELQQLGVKVEVFGEHDLERMNMKSMLAVGQGSANESQLIVLEWKGGDPEQAPLAVVGKGVTFDTGGISIKPSGGMEEMKGDMAGSGVVIGLMKALALSKAKVNVVGVMAMAENMPSGTAQRPADVVYSMSGQTIEVINTDAEGRMVLADALWYTQERFKPCAMIDLATLTGAIVVALGSKYAGLFSNNDELADKLSAAGEYVEEKVWRMPLSEEYDREIDSDIADMKNSCGREAGSITAAQFLQRFVNNTPWVHLDIACVEWSKKDTSFAGKGATGYGVRLLYNFICNNY